MGSYRNLIAWRKSVDLALSVYRATSAFPQDERFGLTQQMRRASVSIASNIAEGHGRDNTGNFVQHLRVAQGSLKELETHLLLSERVGFLARENAQAVLANCDGLGRMMRALIRSLQEKTSK